MRERWPNGAGASSGCAWVTEVDLRASATGEELVQAAADLMVSTLAGAIEHRGRARWVLAGGTTPLALYRRLAADPTALDWSRVEFFWGDERCVPPSAEASNFRAAREALLDPLGIAESRCRRIRGELEPVEAAARYSAAVARVLAGSAWDLVLLGLGSDGHTASLFPPRLPELPAVPALPGQTRQENAPWAVATRAPSPPHARVSLTLPALNRARRILFLVSGQAKAAALARVVAGDPALHASAVAPRAGTVTWCVDSDAAGELPAAVQLRQKP